MSIAIRCSSLLIYQNSAKTNFKVSLVPGHQYYFLCRQFIVKGELGTWKQSRRNSGRQLPGDTECCWPVAAPLWWPGLITEQGLPDPFSKENLLEPLLINLGVLSMSREKDASEQMCASFPVLVPTTSRTRLRPDRSLSSALLMPDYHLQAPCTLNFKFFNRFKGLWLPQSNLTYTLKNNKIFHKFNMFSLLAFDFCCCCFDFELTSHWANGMQEMVHSGFQLSHRISLKSRCHWLMPVQAPIVEMMECENNERLTNTETW